MNQLKKSVRITNRFPNLAKRYNFPDKKPDLLVYNQLQYSTFSNSAEPGFVSKVSNRILNKFGLSYTPPKWEK